MPEKKYDLDRMLAEIEEDKTVDAADKAAKLSQDDIRKMVAEKGERKKEG